MPEFGYAVPDQPALDELARRERRLAETLARKRAELVQLACVRAARRGRPKGREDA